MIRIKKMLPVLILIGFTSFAGCAITLGPNKALLKKSQSTPLLRLVDLTEEVRGSWATDPGGSWRGVMATALQKPEVTTFFSDSSSNLILNLHMVSDHQSDIPRLTNLGFLSMATFGVIPLKYFSEWNVELKATVLTPDKQKTVAEYAVREKGSYQIWAFPPTMFTLFGASIRGENDGWEIARRTCEGAVSKLMAAIDQDYPKLKTYYQSTQSGTAAAVSAQKPLLV